MGQPWDAEFVVQPALARALVESQFPQLAPARVEPFGTGWDNTAYLVSGRWVFRFPRRAIAAPWIVRESDVLPAICTRLPCRVPVPAFRGAPTPAYAWPFAGYERLPGTTACRARLQQDDRRRLAAPLGRFLRALHAVTEREAAALGAGPDELGRMDLEVRVPRAREAIGRARARGLVEDAAALLAVVEAVTDTAPPPERTLVHGDLYARHLLVDEARTLCGVIDWGDVHVGEPALDVAAAFMLLPPASRADFRAAYGPIDAHTWARARFRAVLHQTTVALYAAETGEVDLLEASRYALRHASSAAGAAR